MQREKCTEVLNELSGRCLLQHQLTRLLIMALIRAAEGKGQRGPEGGGAVGGAETRTCTDAGSSAGLVNTEKEARA